MWNLLFMQLLSMARRSTNAGRVGTPCISGAPSNQLLFWTSGLIGYISFCLPLRASDYVTLMFHHHRNSNSAKSLSVTCFNSSDWNLIISVMQEPIVLLADLVIVVISWEGPFWFAEADVIKTREWCISNISHLMIGNQKEFLQMDQQTRLNGLPSNAWRDNLSLKNPDGNLAVWIWSRMGQMQGTDTSAHDRLTLLLPTLVKLVP